MTDKEQIEELYQLYWKYMINKDIAGMDAIMTDDYELRHMTGLRRNKQSFGTGAPGDVRKTDAMEKACEMGRNVLMEDSFNGKSRKQQVGTRL